LGAQTVLEHTLAAVRASGLPWYVEAAGLAGMGDSIAAGVAATPHAHGWLILPGDLPLVQADTLLQVAAALRDHGVVVPHYQGQRGHPVGFAPSCRAALLALEGNQGAARVERAQAAIKLGVLDAGVVMDIDTVDDLARAQAYLDARSPKRESEISRLAGR